MKKFVKITQVKVTGNRYEMNIGASPSGKATDSDSVIRVFESLRPSQQKRNFCLPKVPFLFIHCESNGISTAPMGLDIITEGVYHQPQAVFSFAMMIYKAFALVIYKTSF